MHLNRKQPKVFYGWWVVGASFFIALYVAGVIFYGFTAIFEPIASELGWSYTQISLAASLRGIETGLLSPFLGIMADRWGTRRLIFSGAIIGALGLLLLSRVTSLGMFYAAFFLLALGTSACTMTVLMTAISNWFLKNVGLASGIAVSGFGLGGLLVPVIVKLIDLYDWRVTVALLALGMVAIVLPLSLLFRHKPEHYGYLPDGEIKSAIVSDDGISSSKAIDVSIGTKSALSSNTFWHIAVAYIIHTIVISAVVTHIMPYLSSIGVVRSRSSLVATVNPLMSIVGRLGMGWLGDKVDRRRIAAVAFAMMCLGLLCFGYASTLSVWLLVPFLILFGIGYGGSNVQRPSLVREYFGRKNFGTFFGLMVGISHLGNFVGPALAGWTFDTWGRYQGIWFVYAGLAAIAVISVLTISPVSHTSRKVEEN